jgi:hypothetical protein
MLPDEATFSAAMAALGVTLASGSVALPFQT